LGEVGLTYPGLSGKTKEDFGHGDARFVTYMNVYSNAVANPDGVEAIEKDNRQHEVRNGDVFFTGSSETPDEVGLSSVWLGNSTDTYLNSFCFGYRPSKQLDSLFLASSLRSPQMRSRMILLAQGISRFNISKTQVMQLPLCFPSLPEQRRVGEFFSAIDNLIAAAERQEALLRQKKQAYLQLMFPREGETEPRLRFAGYNGEWERRRFGELYVPSREKNDGSFSTRDIISVAGMRYASRELTDSSDDYMKTYNVMRVGDIAFEGNRSGNFSHGRFVENDLGNGIVSHVFVVLRPLPGRKYDLAFWKEAIHDEFLMRRILARSTKRSTMMHEIVVPDFLKETIRVPSLSEQQKIGEFFTTLDSAIDTSRKRVELLKKQKSAYLQSMFI
jgi:type I restriction enzyme S subunit